MPYTSNKKPSGLDAASSVAASDVLVIEKSGSVQRTTVSQLTDQVFSAKGVTAAGSGSEVAVVRDGATLKDIALSNIVPAGNITDVKVSSNTADRINGNKITPNFGSQNVTTTGATSTGTLAASGNATVGGTLVVTGLLTANGGINATITGNSTTATQLANARNIAATGDVAWNVNFNGSADVTAAATIQNNVISDAKLRSAGACSVIGRSANSTGNVADIASVADDTVLRRESGILGFGQVATGAIADSAVTTPKIADASSTTTGVTNSKLRHSSGLSVIGRSANTVGAPADISGTDGQVFRVSGTALGFGQVATAGIATGAVTANELATGAVTGALGGGKLAASAIVGQTQLTDPLASGDEFLVHDASAAALRRVAWSSLQQPGTVIKTEYAQLVGVNTYTGNTLAPTATSPTISNGHQILAINNFAVSSATNYVIIQVASMLGASNALSCILMLFAGNTLLATSATPGNNAAEQHKIIFKHTPGNTSPVNYTVRAATETGNLFVNRLYTVTDYNTGKQVSSMLIQEIKG